MDHPGEIIIRDANGHGYTVVDVQPKANPTEIPAYLPPNVAKAFKEGCDVLKIAPNAACGAFRRALELALKDLSPDIDAWKLEKRIDKMATEGKLTSALRDWAHKLRLDGNQAVHEEDVTQSEAKEVESLARFVLMYLFTLPESVKRAQGESQT